MSNLHDYSLSLVLDENDAMYVRSLSRELNLGFGEFRPHMTVLFADDQPEKPLFAEAGVTIEARNLYFWTDDVNRIWVGLTVNKTQELTDLYRRTAVFANRTYSMDGFFPHVTLGCLGKSALEDVDMAHIYKSSKRHVFLNCTLAVCRNGEYGKVVEVLR